MHTVHLDANLNVTDSDQGTVLVGMMIQSVLSVNGKPKPALPTAVAPKPSKIPPPPPLGFLTFIGLATELDVMIDDDQSAVFADLYAEQLQKGHLSLSGTGVGTVPGRVTIQGWIARCPAHL